MKTAKYRKRCFDQIEGITATNKELAAEVERLRRQLEAADQERTDRETQNQNLVGQLNNKELEKTSKVSSYHSKCRTCVVVFLVVTAIMLVWKLKWPAFEGKIAV